MEYSSVRRTETILCPVLSKVVPGGLVRAVRSSQMAKEATRLATFRNWFPGPYGSPSPQALAAAGFISRGVADQAQCFSCSLVVWKWRLEHNPLYEHYRYSPTCRYMSNMILPDIPTFLPSSTALLSDAVTNTKSLQPEIETEITPNNNSTESVAPLCKICFDEEMCALFYPCKHLLTCITCAKKLLRCPICRCFISSIIRVFISFE